jgi:hypothetical protein
MALSDWWVNLGVLKRVSLRLIKLPLSASNGVMKELSQLLEKTVKSKLGLVAV